MKNIFFRWKMSHYFNKHFSKVLRHSNKLYIAFNFRFYRNYYIYLITIYLIFIHYIIISYNRQTPDRFQECLLIFPDRLTPNHKAYMWIIYWILIVDLKRSTCLGMRSEMTAVKSKTLKLIFLRVDSLARLLRHTSFRLIILTASCGRILIFNTPFCSEFNVFSCSFM